MPASTHKLNKEERRCKLWKAGSLFQVTRFMLKISSSCHIHQSLINCSELVAIQFKSLKGEIMLEYLSTLFRPIQDNT